MSIKTITRCLYIPIGLSLYLFFILPLNGQNVIGGMEPTPTALLDIQSTDKGLLVPRLSTEQRLAIEQPATGLMIYNTTLHCLELNIGTKDQPVWSCIMQPTLISQINCQEVTLEGALYDGWPAERVSISVPYEGGNGLSYVTQNYASTGVTGLTATLSSGVFDEEAGQLLFTVTGTPSGIGTASFSINIGDLNCEINLEVTVAPPSMCGAYVAAGVWKQFMCHNLGAITSADPFMPSWELIGDYYQWGRAALAAAGPSGPGTSQVTQANSGPVSGWNQTVAPNGSWSDAMKTANDPCPKGYRVPTLSEWQGVLNTALNSRNFIGSNWSNTSTNYTTGLRFGSSLFLPAAGYRDSSSGELYVRGNDGYYWSSTEISSSDAWTLGFNSSSALTLNINRAYGFSVRCIAE